VRHFKPVIDNQGTGDRIFTPHPSPLPFKGEGSVLRVRIVHLDQIIGRETWPRPEQFPSPFKGEKDQG